jgi:hypothetical protein
MQLPHAWIPNIAGAPGQYGLARAHTTIDRLACELTSIQRPAAILLQVPHPWTTNIAGAPGQYGQYLGPDGAPLGILVPNPAAPDDPR